MFSLCKAQHATPVHKYLYSQLGNGAVPLQVGGEIAPLVLNNFVSFITSIVNFMFGVIFSLAIVGSVQ